MFILSSSIIIIINLIALVASKPIEQIFNKDFSKDPSLAESFREAQMVLNRYQYVIQSDNDHLIHGMLYILLNSPLSFPYIPPRALDLALKSLEQKLGRAEVEVLIKPLLLAIEQHYAEKTKNIPTTTTVKLTDETKQKIEEALDKFLDDDSYPPQV